MAKPDPYFTTHGSAFWSAEHQARLRQMGDMTTFGPKKSPEPWPTFSAPSDSSATTSAPITYSSGGNASGERLPLTIILLRFAALLGAIAAGTQAANWWVGGIALIVLVAMVALLERFFATRVGEVVLLFIEGTLILSVLGSIAAIFVFPTYDLESNWFAAVPFAAAIIMGSGLAARAFLSRHEKVSRIVGRLATIALLLVAAAGLLYGYSIYKT